MLGAISLDLFAVLLVRRLGAAAGLCARHTGAWPLGPRPAARGARHRRHRRRRLACRPPDPGPCRHDHARSSWPLFGAFTVVFGVSTLTWLSIFALAMLGATDMVSVYVRETLIQLWTPDELRGRVNAVNRVFVGASNELGEFRAGTMAALIGTVPAVVFGGVGALAVAGIWAWLFPELRKVRHLRSGA